MEVMRESLHQGRRPALPEGGFDGASPHHRIGHHIGHHIGQGSALPERLPWVSAALATGGLSLLLWGVLIAGFAALRW